MIAAHDHDDREDDTAASGVDVAAHRQALDPRVQSVWHTWLSALAVDAEAALAASLAYESLAPEGREAWLEALEDTAGLGVPAVALYAPLLAVEEDDERRVRITQELAPLGEATISRRRTVALLGEAGAGERVCAILSPIYLDFVDVLVCRYGPDCGFISARRDPVRNAIDIFGRGTPQDDAESPHPPTGCETTNSHPNRVVDGVVVTAVPLRDVVEDLAHAVVADRRRGRAAPEVLKGYVHLFALDVSDLDLQLDLERCGVPTAKP
jgi:hypothetical protein